MGSESILRRRSAQLYELAHEIEGELKQLAAFLVLRQGINRPLSEVKATWSENIDSRLSRRRRWRSGFVPRADSSDKLRALEQQFVNLGVQGIVGPLPNHTGPAEVVITRVVVTIRRDQIQPFRQGHFNNNTQNSFTFLLGGLLALLAQKVPGLQIVSRFEVRRLLDLLQDFDRALTISRI